MKITSQFFLTYYPGSTSLDLMQLPSSFAGNSKLTAQYNRFIEGISTIYGSQLSDGTIPTFWTIPDGYGYVPSTESTLTSLQPKQSYYFVIRDESYLPLIMPTVNNLLPGFTDFNKLPLIDATGTTTISSSNYAYLRFTVSGLQPYEDYKYSFNSIASNWPTTISAKSGIIKPSDDNIIIDAVMMFCSQSGSCVGDANALSYTISPSNINYDNLYSIVNLELTPVSFPEESITSDIYTVRCSGCIPTPKYPNVVFSNSTLTLSTGCCSGTYPMVVTASNVNVGQKYYYEFSSTTANITFAPQSGYIYFGTGVSHNINTLLSTDLSRNQRGIIQINLTDTANGNMTSDYLTISCSPLSCEV